MFLNNKALLLLCITAVTLFSASCCTEKRSRTFWHKEKTIHQGTPLTENEIVSMADRSDMRHFKEVLQPLLLPRIPDTPNHAIVREHIVSSLEKLKWKVEQDSFINRTPIGDKTFTNIVATLNPHATRRLVLACHYDSKIMDGQVFVGATDSSVPCAMMINLAYIMDRELQQHKQSDNDITLQLIFFDGEEAFRSWTSTDSLYGSRYMAKKLAKTPYPKGNEDKLTELHRMDMMVLLDLIGTSQSTFMNYFSDTKRWFDKMRAYEGALKRSGKLHHKNAMFPNKNLYNAGIQDDHIPFLKRKVPILHLIPVPFPSVWHKVTDNEKALDYQTIENLNSVLRAFVADYLSLQL